jgi:hypothetical protein
MQMLGSRCSRTVVISGWPSSASGARPPTRPATPAGQEIAAGLHEMHAKPPLLDSGVDLQSSRFRERLDRRRHGSANSKHHSAVSAA